jgi:hypothetical protein
MRCRVNADHIAIVRIWSTPVIENSALNFRKWPTKQIYLGYEDSTARFK